SWRSVFDASVASATVSGLYHLLKDSFQIIAQRVETKTRNAHVFRAISNTGAELALRRNIAEMHESSNILKASVSG
ncbi:unnamed protein product, partial [Arctia plantaginis]